jgi:multidrug resistance efflux pump
MIIVLALLYIAPLLLAFKLGILEPTLFWKLSPLIWMVFLLIALFIPMQFWAPSGPLIVTQWGVQIVANVAGEVTEVPVEPNVPLAKGDVLFRIDPTPYQAAVDQLSAQLELTRTRLDQARRLAERGAGSRYDVEQYTSQVEQLEAQLRSAEFNLTETTVRAPADGYVTNVALRPGARVVNFPFVQAMAFVESTDQVVGAQIFQNHLRFLEPGQPAEIAFKMYPGRVFDAEVEYVLQVSATGQVGLSGFAAAPKQLPHTPFWVRLALGEEARALELPVGATGTTAIYTGTGKPTHIIRKVMIRMEAIKNYVVPF